MVFKAESEGGRKSGNLMKFLEFVLNLAEFRFFRKIVKSPEISQKCTFFRSTGEGNVCDFPLFQKSENLPQNMEFEPFDSPEDLIFRRIIKFRTPSQN